MEILLLIEGSFFQARTECSAIWSLLGHAKVKDNWHRGAWYFGTKLTIPLMQTWRSYLQFLFLFRSRS